MHAQTSYVMVDKGAIKHNARLALKLCPEGSRVWFVTKVVAGDEKIISSLLECGSYGLADSRLENLAGIRKTNPNTKTMLIRPAGLQRAAETIALCDVSLESSIENITALGQAASKTGKTHNIIVMIELGDLREGVMELDASNLIKRVLETTGINVEGIGSSLTCYAGVVPDTSHMNRMIALRDSLEKELGVSLNWISSGATNTLPLCLNGQLPKEINDHRIGEGIMLGTDVTDRGILKGFRPDAFALFGEVMEVYSKPTVPTGRISQNVSGHVLNFEDKGKRRRALVNFGMADVDSSLLKPLIDGIKVVGSTSDHTILDVEDAKDEIKVGSQIGFLPGYGALVRIMNSKYISKQYKEV